ncbi:MAG: hypothetical protein M1541_07390 [Acidobacteria bacterium]|nr:hypothetical protein [Acidobacteriota bacterium]
MKTQLRNNKYLVMKAYMRGLEWHCMFHTNDLGRALADYNERRTNEPDTDFLLVATIESTVISGTQGIS